MEDSTSSRDHGELEQPLDSTSASVMACTGLAIGSSVIDIAYNGGQNY